MSILHYDWESKSDLDLPVVGLDVYAKGKNTDIICGAFAFDDEPVQLWLPGQPVPKRVFNHIEAGGEIWAHSAEFERHMCNYVATRKYGFPYMYVEQMVCTKAKAFAMGLPGSLANAAAALGVEQQKDIIGNRIMLQYCRPKEIIDGKPVWWDIPEGLQTLYKYCIQDVEVERAIGKRMLKLSSFEREVYVLDQKINDRGIKVDVSAAFAANVIVEQEKSRLNSAIQKASSNRIATCNAVAQIKKYLKESGFDVESLAKSDVIELLDNREIALPADCRNVLLLRQQAGKASTAKLDAMVTGASSDNRIRGTFQYSGANTRRWAGRRIQLQNLKRPTIKQSVIDSVMADLKRGTSAEEIELIYGSPLDVLSNCVRGFIIPECGHDFLVADYSAIEARVIAWLSGQESVLEIFRTHGKIYEHAASSIFSSSQDSITGDQRQIGKVAVLALGYGGGVGALQQMAKGYGVKLAPAFKGLWDLADTSTREWALKFYEQNREDYLDISREEFLSSELTKTFWRRNNPNIVAFWGSLEAAAIKAVKMPNTKFEAGPISYLTKGSFLFCRLPSGGVISYPYPEVKVQKTKWDTNKETLSYKAEDGQSKQWLRFSTYGGSLAENVTQAVARDLLADSMLRLDKAGFDIVAHVHDEIICEARKNSTSVDDVTKIMCDLPLWAKGIPVAAIGWQGERYAKR